MIILKCSFYTVNFIEIYYAVINVALCHSDSISDKIDILLCCGSNVKEDYI